MQVVLKAAIFALAVIASAAIVFAQPPGGPGGQRQGGPPQGGNDPGRAVLMALDTDGNHEISADEIKYSSVSLAKLDSNGDGKLTESDLAGGNANQRRQRGGQQRGGQQRGNQQAGRPGPPEDAQGPPSPEQLVTNAMEFDANNDGKLDATELLKFAQQLGPPPGQDGGNRQQRPARPGQ